ncbi:hypothetical protein KEM56_003531 [Ascosphaera pollenicola]|nr:hypothetical protein KEM56_003531 [Ascosphaera pollenicola]
MYQRGFLFDVVRNHTRNDQHCDLKIICGDDVFNVHRFILYFQSDFFAKVCEGRALESPKQEITLHEPAVLIDQMIKFFYEGAYAPHLEKPALTRWMNERAQSQATSGGKVLPGKRVVDPTATDARITTAVFHVSMYALASRYSIAGLKEEAKDATVACLKELSTLEILEHCVPEVYSAVAASDKDTAEFRKAVTGVLMDKLIYQSPKEEKARISSVNEAMVDGFPVYAKDLEERVLDRENEITEMRAEVGLR